jgi:hypothetical protein
MLAPIIFIYVPNKSGCEHATLLSSEKVLFILVPWEMGDLRMPNSIWRLVQQRQILPYRQNTSKSQYEESEWWRSRGVLLVGHNS